MTLFSAVQLFVTPWTAAYQASLSMRFSRLEYWSGLPFPSLSLSLYIYIYMYMYIIKICIFELWCWRRLLRDPWTARRSIRSILKEFNPEYSLE